MTVSAATAGAERAELAEHAETIQTRSSQGTQRSFQEDDLCGLGDLRVSIRLGVLRCLSVLDSRVYRDLPAGSENASRVSPVGMTTHC